MLREAKLSDLLPESGNRLEASGVVHADGRLVVVFDNMPDIARLDPSLVPGHPGTDLVPRLQAAAEHAGYEGIASDGQRYFAVVESAPHPDGRFRPWIHELDGDLRPVRWSIVDVPVERSNKGLEGLCCVRRHGRTHLLALHEPAHGGGRVEVLAEHDSGGWRVVDTMRLPDVGLADCSGIAVRDRRIAVVSQRSSALWVGVLAETAWQVVGAGTVYRFPRSRRVRYDAVEGVTWLDDATLALVSDRSRRRRSARRRRVEQSVHVVRLPDVG